MTPYFPAKRLARRSGGTSGWARIWNAGANTELTKIKLTFTSAADILAGGYDLTIGPETEIVPFNGRYPDLYGGGKSSIVGDTSLKVMSGTFGSVYGGGSQTTASIDGGTNVIIPATGTSDMAKSEICSLRAVKET